MFSRGAKKLVSLVFLKVENKIEKTLQKYTFLKKEGTLNQIGSLHILVLFYSASRTSFNRLSNAS